MVAYLNHVTLSTGHSVRVPRDAVSEDALAEAAALLRESLAARTIVPLRPDARAHYGLQALADSRKLIVTIHAPAGPHVAGKPYRGARTPLITMAVAPRALDGPKLWDLITRQAQTPDVHRPSAPWAAIWLHQSLAAYLDATTWLGGLEQALAWVWIERRHD